MMCSRELRRSGVCCLTECQVTRSVHLDAKGGHASLGLVGEQHISQLGRRVALHAGSPAVETKWNVPSAGTAVAAARGDSARRCSCCLWERHAEEHSVCSHEQDRAHLATPVWRCQEVLHAALINTSANQPTMLTWTMWCCHYPQTRHVACCSGTACASLDALRTLAFSISPKRLMIDDTLTM
jgi:hypothetical protein